jgi:hypothetical protein
MVWKTLSNCEIKQLHKNIAYFIFGFIGLNIGDNFAILDKKDKKITH